MPSIRLKSLKPKPLQVTKFGKEILDALRQEGREIEKLYNQSSNTWNPKPKFSTDFRVRLLDASVRISTRDVRYVNLDLGTRKRWAVMSSPFSPKSKVRSLSASSGSGKPVIRGRSAMQSRGIAPRSGIKPRKFSKEIIKVRQPLFTKNMRGAMKKAAKGSF